MSVSQVGFELDTLTVPCTAKDLKATFGWLLLEMRAVAQVLRPDERTLVRQLLSHTGKPLTVLDVFPDFQRECEGHKTLRRLRAAQFVYPKRTGRWEPDEPITVTPFARMMWDQLGEQRIFEPPPPPPPQPKGTSIDSHTPPPKHAVVTWDNLLDHIRERQRVLATEGKSQKD